MSNKYSFPILKTAEILGCMTELNIPTIETDLTNPTSEKVLVVYQQLVELLLGLRREDMTQQLFTEETLENPELHEDSVPMMAIFFNSKKLMLMCGIDDFTLPDITQPEAKRLRRNLSAIINFAKFHEEQAGRYAEFSKEPDVLSAEKQQLEEENERLISQITEAQRQRTQEAPEEQRLTAENEKLSEKVQKVWNDATAIQQESHSLKENLRQVKEELSEKNTNIANSKNEIESLLLQIAPDPRKLKADILTLRDAEQKERAEIKHLEQKLSESSGHKQAIERTQKELQDIHKLQKECEAEEEKLKELNRKLKDHGEHATRDEATKTDQEHHIKQLTQKKMRMLERIEKSESQYSSKHEAAMDALSAMKKQWHEVDSQRSKESQLVEDSDGQIRDLRDKLHKAQMDHQHEVTKVQQQQQELAARVRAYHEDLVCAMQAVESSQQNMQPVSCA